MKLFSKERSAARGFSREVTKMAQELFEKRMAEQKQQELDLFQSQGFNIRILEDLVNSTQFGVKITLTFENGPNKTTAVMESKDDYDKHKESVYTPELE